MIQGEGAARGGVASNAGGPPQLGPTARWSQVTHARTGGGLPTPRIPGQQQATNHRIAWGAQRNDGRQSRPRGGSWSQRGSRGRPGHRGVGTDGSAEPGGGRQGAQRGRRRHPGIVGHRRACLKSMAHSATGKPRPVGRDMMGTGDTVRVANGACDPEAQLNPLIPWGRAHSKGWGADGEVARWGREGDPRVRRQPDGQRGEQASEHGEPTRRARLRRGRHRYSQVSSQDGRAGWRGESGWPRAGRSTQARHGARIPG